MKMLIISFVFWILVIASLVASFLILTVLAAFVPFAVFRCCLVGIAIAPRCRSADLSGSFRSHRSRALDSARSHRSCCLTNSSEEKTMKCLVASKSALNTVLALLSLVTIAAAPALADSGSARTVKYSQRDVVPVHAKIRFSTLIVLPQNEEILDFATGDKDFWIINGVHNLCYVHPAQTGIRTDLHLITSTGHVYSFLLTEISTGSNTEPDLKIFIEPKEQSNVAGSTGLEGFVRAGEVEAYKREIECCAPRPPTRFEPRSRKALNKPTSSGPNTRADSALTMSLTEKPRGNRFWSAPSSTMMPLPTSSVQPRRNLRCMK